MRPNGSTFHLRLATVLLLSVVAAGAIPAVDLGISRAFFRNGHWMGGKTGGWQFLSDYGCWPALVMVVATTLLWATSHVVRRWGRWRRPCLIMALTVLLGPGLLVNGLIKPFWGRPRPLHVQGLGGHQGFRTWWQPSVHLTTDRGFASGHAATAFSLIAGALVIPPRYRRWRPAAVAGAVTFGTLVSLSRVVQGRHFFSDVAISAALTYWIAALLLVFPFEAVSGWFKAQYVRRWRPRCAVRLAPIEAEAS